MVMDGRLGDRGGGCRTGPLPREQPLLFYYGTGVGHRGWHRARLRLQGRALLATHGNCTNRSNWRGRPWAPPGLIGGRAVPDRLLTEREEKERDAAIRHGVESQRRSTGNRRIRR